MSHFRVCVLTLLFGQVLGVIEAGFAPGIAFYLSSW